MATSEEIALQGRNYTGNAALGGGNFGTAALDTRPLQDLGRYTMLYNKTEYEANQKRAEEQAEQIADLTAFDPNSPIKKYRDELYGDHDELMKWVRENPDALDYRNKDKWLEYNDRKNKLKRKINAAKTNAVIYEKRLEEIRTSTRPELKDFLQRRLDQEINDKDIFTPLRYTEQWDVSPVAVSGAAQKEFDVTVEGDNTRAVRKFKMVDMKSVSSMANSIASGLLGTYVDKNSPEYLNASPELRALYDQESEATKATGKLEPVESAKILSDIILKYKTPEGVVDVNRMYSENKDNDIVLGVIGSIEGYNRRMQEYRTAIKNGSYTDKFGNKITFGNLTGVNAEDFSDIDITDGITPQEILKARILGATAPDGYKTEVKDTDRAIKQEKNAIDRQRANADAAYKRAMAGVAQMKAKAYVDKLKFDLATAKSIQEQDAILESEWKSNLISQKTLVSPTATTGVVASKMPYETSIPIYTIGSASDVQILIPKGATKTIDTKTGKLVNFKGGHYDIEYIDKASNRSLSGNDLRNAYSEFKNLAAKNNIKWSGSLDDYLKMQIEDDAFEVKLVGENGSTTQRLHTAGQRIIANQNTKKGQVSVFNSTNEPPTDETITEDVSVSTTTQENEQER